MSSPAEKILDFSAPLDVALFDQIVGALYAGANPEQMRVAHQLLAQFQEHPDAWTRVDTILEKSANMNSKYLGLQVLEKCAQQRWKILPMEQRQAVKSYIVNLIIKLSSTPDTYREQKLLITKLNRVLIEIVRQEWPAQWPNFISEIVGSSQTNETLCENNMHILKLLSEEVFDCGSEKMTSAKIKQLKAQFNQDFSTIFQLCLVIFERSQSPTLLLATLNTLLRFLSWIPLGFIFETTLLEILVSKFLPVPGFRNVALACLTEIGSMTLESSDYENKVAAAFAATVQKLGEFLSPDADFTAAFGRGSEQDRQFTNQLAIFVSAFMRTHLVLIETHCIKEALLAVQWLTRISEVREKEVFKVCLEFWNYIAHDLFHREKRPPPARKAPLGFAAAGIGPMEPPPPPPSARMQAYAPLLSFVRRIVISRMAKPEEILIVQDESGQIVREFQKDTDTIVLYKTMRETLILLAHLDIEDTERIMQDRLQGQMTGAEYSFYNLNTLCWAIGAISGTMDESAERRFLVIVIRDLLNLCEAKEGKDNKAVIASNIMFIVAQYPRFLRAHWRFLKTVANKLFEFMHESFEGVQDMACDTFLKIAKQCKRKFAVLQPHETMPFIDEILLRLPQIISDLERQQIETFYESMGYIVASQSNPREREALVRKLFEMLNHMWKNIMASAGQSLNTLQESDVQRNILSILRTNTRVANSLGHPYGLQLGVIYMDMLNIYKAFNDMISTLTSTQGARATENVGVRQMRAIKKEILKLVQAFISHSEDPQAVAETFMPPLMDSVLNDYQRAIPEARDAEVLSLCTAIIKKLKSVVLNKVPSMLSVVFECTLAMITKNFEDYPDHRVNFFLLLRAINNECFQAFFMIPAHHFKLVVDSIIWAFKHAERNIAESGLNLLLELLKNISASDVASQFYQSYYLPLLQDILFVLTDTFHQPGFKLQTQILLTMIRLIKSGQISVPVWGNQQVPAGTNNETFLRQFLADLLARSFQNLLPVQIQTFINLLFATDDLGEFKSHIRDFLIQLQQFADSTELFREEQQAVLEEQRRQELERNSLVPGLVEIPLGDDIEAA